MSSPEKRSSRGVGPAALGGFILGAATVLLVLWLYRKGSEIETASPPAVPPVAATPAPGPAAPSRPAPVNPLGAPAGDLARRGLLVPVQGIPRAQLSNTFEDSRSEGRVHEAIDIMAPRDTPVLAVEGGRIAKLFTSRLGGLTIYQFDPTETYTYYYAHLERYAPGLAEGAMVARGQVIGYVGSSGNAGPDNPHLHFAIFKLNGNKNWWEGEAVNPYPVLGQGP